MSLELGDYSLTEKSLSQIKPKVRSKRKRLPTSRKFGYLGTGIPGDWLSVAGRLPGKTLHVALAVWLAYGVTKEPRFRFGNRWLAWFDVGPSTKRESLCRLRDAGLIRLEHRPGSSPIVTVCNASGSSDEE